MFFLLGLVASGFNVFFVMNAQIATLKTEVKQIQDQLLTVPGEEQVTGWVDERLRTEATKPVAIANGQAARNQFSRSMVVVGFCTGTTTSKRIDAKIGENAGALSLVATE